MSHKVGLAFVVSMLILGVGSANAATRRITLEHLDIITSPRGESRILLGFGELSGFEDLFVTAAFLDFTLPAVAPSSDLEIEVRSVSTRWSSGAVTWTSPWQEAGGDLGDAEPSVTLVASQEISRLRINVTETVRQMVAGDAPQNGFLLTNPLPGRSGFNAAERAVVAALSEGRLVVTCANAKAAGRRTIR